MKNHYGCPVKATSNVLAGKWKVLIVWHLSFGPRRFAELRKLVSGVSEKVLASQLRQLENDGVVRRIDARTSPPRVDYCLTPAGEELIPLMQAMCDWGSKHFGLVPNLPRIQTPSAPLPKEIPPASTQSGSRQVLESRDI